MRGAVHQRARNVFTSHPARRLILRDEGEAGVFSIAIVTVRAFYPLLLELVPLAAINFCGEYLQIPRNVKTSHILPL